MTATMEEHDKKEFPPDPKMRAFVVSSCWRLSQLLDYQVQSASLLHTATSLTDVRFIELHFIMRTSSTYSEQHLAIDPVPLSSWSLRRARATWRQGARCVTAAFPLRFVGA